MSFYSHESAVIDDGAEIGDGTKIWHFVHVSSKSVIGRDCSIGQNVYVASNVKIGNRVKIQNNVSVFENVTLEDDVFCGPSMVFTNVLNPRAFIEKKSEFKDTLIGHGATLGANCTIVCGVFIDRFAFVGAGTVVTKDVPRYALVVGNPARQIGWRSEHGEKLDLPLEGAGSATCPVTGECYELLDGNVRKV